MSKLNYKGIVYEAHTQEGHTNIAYHEKTGDVKWGVIAKATEIEGRIYKAYTRIEFHENGKLMSGLLEEDTKINGKVYRSGTLIKYDKKGRVIDGWLK